MKREIEYKKYEQRGADFHYKKIKKSVLGDFSAYIYARYYLELQILNKIIAKFQNTNEKLKILDIGCGDAVFINMIYLMHNKKKLELYGIDSSSIAIEAAKIRNPNAIFKVANVYNLPFEDNYFDIIVSSDVIEHILEPNKMLMEIKRTAKNNSFVIIGTPIKFTEFPFDKMHSHEFFPNEFKNFLTTFFFNVKIVESHNLLNLLLYEKYYYLFFKKRALYRYLINFLTIYFNRNPFLKIKSKNDKKEFYTYMFGIGSIKKKEV